MRVEYEKLLQDTLPDLSPLHVAEQPEHPGTISHHGIPVEIFDIPSPSKSRLSLTTFDRAERPRARRETEHRSVQLLRRAGSMG